MLETFTPTGKLKHFVKCYIIVDCDETIVNSMLPGTSLTLGFRYKGTTKYLTDRENTLPFAVVAGLRKSIQLMKDDTNTGNLLVIFNTEGAAAFFKEQIHEMFGEVLSLNEFSNFKELNALEDRLCEAKSSEQRIQIIESFLLTKLYDYKQDPLIANAVEVIKTHNGLLKIKDLAARHFLSLDAFEKRFRRAVGASPKQFSYIVRMNSIIGSLNKRSITETVFEAGYYDQAHFTKDFKLFTGQTPTVTLRSTTSCVAIIQRYD